MTEQLANLTLQQVRLVLQEAVKDQQTNEQWFLDFLDVLNDLSVSF